MTEEKETKKPVVKVTFRLDILRPDKRQYKQQSMELIPVEPLNVLVEVPCTSDYVVNSANINASVLGNEDVPEPVFTPAGLAYISNQIEQHFSDPEPEDFVLEESKEDTGWETETETTDTGWETEEDTADDWESSDDSSDDDNDWTDNDSDWE